MPTYQFEAMDATGREIKDTIEAPNEEEAQATIRQMGYFVTKISGKRERVTNEKGKLASGKGRIAIVAIVAIIADVTLFLVVGFVLCTGYREPLSWILVFLTVVCWLRGGCFRAWTRRGQEQLEREKLGESQDSA